MVAQTATKFFLVVLVLVVANLTSAQEIPDDPTIRFFEGEVEFITGDFDTTTFRVIKGNAVIRVKNAAHLRLVDDPFNLPSRFKILAPYMAMVEVLEGVVPSSLIKHYPISRYLALEAELNSKWFGNDQQQADPQNEQVVSIEDTDLVFSLTRPQWEAYANKIALPEHWDIRLFSHDTGTSIAAIDPESGFGLGIQPFFEEPDAQPHQLSIGSYYPQGVLPVTKETYADSSFKIRVEDGARSDLGSGYSVFSTFLNVPPFDVITIWISKK